MSTEKKKKSPSSVLTACLLSSLQWTVESWWVIRHRCYLQECTWLRFCPSLSTTCLNSMHGTVYPVEGIKNVTMNLAVFTQLHSSLWNLKMKAICSQSNHNLVMKCNLGLWHFITFVELKHHQISSDYAHNSLSAILLTRISMNWRIWKGTLHTYGWFMLMHVETSPNNNRVHTLGNMTAFWLLKFIIVATLLLQITLYDLLASLEFHLHFVQIWMFWCLSRTSWVALIYLAK